MFQVMCNLAMEPPVRTDSESVRNEKVKVLKAMPSLEANNLVRGQFKGYLDEPGVAPDSKVETFAALRLEIDSWRWKGVPFYIRAGKNLPLTCTEVMARFRRPPTIFSEGMVDENYVRFRISPQITIAIGTNVMTPGSEMQAETVEMLATRHPRPDEMMPYELLLGDAMAGDSTLFARQDYVEEAWRIVDPVLKETTPVYQYDQHTWGPKEVNQKVTPPGGWDTLTAADQEGGLPSRNSGGMSGARKSAPGRNTNFSSRLLKQFLSCCSLFERARLFRPLKNSMGCVLA
jgi:glucose-6-phosphate 1-dehydrogenase